MNGVELGKALSAKRRMKNISQSQLANMLCVSPQAVSKWENGDSLPDIFMLVRLSQILGFKLDNLFGLDETDSDSQENKDILKGSEKTLNKDMSMANWKNADFSQLKNVSEKFILSNIDNCSFEASDLSKLVLKANNLKNSNLKNASLVSSTLSASSVIKNDFSNADFKDGIIRSCNINECDFTSANFEDALLKTNNITSSTFKNTVFKNVELKNNNLKSIVFESNFDNCLFISNNFSKCEFKSATLTNCFFKNKSLKSLKFTDCTIDKITLSFLRACKADV